MEPTISIEEIKKLPHIDCDNLGGRIFPSLPLLDDEGHWHSWFPIDGKLLETDFTLAEGAFFTRSEAIPGDICFLFLEFLYQRALWPSILPLAKGILADLFNVASSLTKLELFFKAKGVKPLEASRMVATEIEYVFMTCRSLFDLLQETLKRLWDTVTLTDASLRKAQLPSSFRKMVLHDESALTAAEISDKRQIPLVLAEIYESCTEFFVWLREYRDYIVHRGTSVELVFEAKNGFAIRKGDRPFCDMPIWNEGNSLPNGLGSAKSAVSHIILTTFRHFESFIIQFQKVILFPPMIAPDYRVFIRGPHIPQLSKVETGITASPWYSTEDDE